MDAEVKHAIVNKIFLSVSAALVQNGCVQPEVNVVLYDTDLAPLQPLIGDHVIVSVAAVIRLEDYLKMNPTD